MGLTGLLDIYSSGFLINVAAALLVNLLAVIIFAKRFQVVLSQLGQPLSSVHSFFITNSVQLASYVAPLGAGALISKPLLTYFYSKVPVRKTLLAVFFEQIFTLYWDMFLLLSILFFVGGAFFDGVRALTVGVWLSILIVFTYSLVKYEKVFLFVVERGGRYPGLLKKILAKFGLFDSNGIASLKLNSRALLNRGFLLRYSVYIVSVIVLLPLTLYFTSRSYGVEIFYVSAFGCYWGSMILGRLSGLPGGIGVRDVSMGALLVYLAVPATDAAAITILNRLVVTLQYVVIGAPLLARAMKDATVIELMKRFKG